MDKAIQICQLFNVSVDDLLNQDIKELNNNKIAKSNINKFIDDVLNYVYKTINLFSNLKFKERLKCILEQLLLIIIFYIISMIILSIFGSFLSHLLSILPNNIYTFIFNLLNDIGILLTLLGIIILLGQLIIVIFNFINNRKNVVKKVGIVLMITLISIGIGLGFIVLSLPKFDYYDTDSMQ